MYARTSQDIFICLSNNMLHHHEGDIKFIRNNKHATIKPKNSFLKKMVNCKLVFWHKKKNHFCILNLMVPYGHRSPHLFFKSLLPTTLTQPLNFDYTQHSLSRSEFLFFKLNTSANLLYAVLWYNPNEDKEEWFARVLDKYMLSMEDE